MTMDEKQAQEVRKILRNELDFQLMLTDTVWGRAEISKELKDKLSQKYGHYDEAGNLITTTENLWSLLGFYTRDMRLGNLSKFDGEIYYCQYYLDLAGDCLQEGYIQAFLICLSRVATLLELSQSKSGFFRKRSNTITQEHFEGQMEPEKKSLFGKSRRE